MFVSIVWLLGTLASLISLFWAYRFYREMLLADEGDEAMREIADSVRRGADAYLRQQ